MKTTPSIPLALATLALSVPAAAQIDLRPRTVEPAAWERFTLAVVNQTDTNYVRVRIDVPQAVMVLGVERQEGWTAQHQRATDEAPQQIVWSGGAIRRGEYREFAFLGRIPGDVRRERLVFPAEITRASGSHVVWDRRRDTGTPPTVQIVGTTAASGWATLALSGVAVGIAALALVFSLYKRGHARD